MKENGNANIENNVKIKFSVKHNKKAFTALVLGAMYAVGSFVSVGAASVDYVVVNSTEDVPVVTGNNSVAVGAHTEAKGQNALSLGNGAKANALNSIAEGLGSSVSEVAAGAIAMGTGATVDNAPNYSDGLSNGNKAKLNGQHSIAVGTNAHTIGSQAIAMGVNTLSSGQNTIAIGQSAKSYGENSLVLGSNASTSESYVYYGVTYDMREATAIGNTASVKGGYGTAVGTKSKAHGVNSTAYGNSARVLNGTFETDNTEIKELVKSLTINNQKFNETTGELAYDGSGGVAIGSSAVATGWGASAIGFQAYALHSQTSALGDDAKAMNYAASAVGTHSYASGEQSTALGNGAEALGNQSAALGAGAAATGNQALAAGWGAGASGKNAIALGTSTKSVNTWYTKGSEKFTYATELAQWNASGDYSIAVGTDALASASDAVAVGRNATSTAADTVAIGREAKSTDTNSVAIGRTAESSKANGVALGYNAKSSVEGGVALGSESVASREALQNVSVTNTASAANNQVYGAANSTDTAKAAIAATVKGNLSAVSVGSDSATRQITHVAAGSEDSDAVNVAQLKSVETSVREYVNANAVDVKEGDGIIVTETPAGTDEKGNAKKHTFTVSLAEDIRNSITNNTNNITKLGDQVSTIGDQVTVLGDQVTINTGDIKDLKSQVTNNTQTINTHTEQINDLSKRVNGVDGRINSLDNRMDKVGAGAAALAGLHPLDFNPDDKWSFSVGYGNYGNANAMAVGAFYRPNEDVMVNVASSMGNGENMISAGLNFNIGQSSGVSRSRVAMAKEIEILKARIDKLEAQQRSGVVNNAGQTSAALDVNFPDVPANHWAYAYVKTLADKGLLVGYPDGQFKGNQTMTRYEFAAVIYRALQNGALVDGTMARATEEFAREMAAVEKADRFRVDLVHGKPSDRYKVERIRVNSEDKESRDVYGGYTKM